jgi:hypothetical protein
MICFCGEHDILYGTVSRNFYPIFISRFRSISDYILFVSLLDFKVITNPHGTIKIGEFESFLKKS